MYDFKIIIMSTWSKWTMFQSILLGNDNAENWDKERGEGGRGGLQYLEYLIFSIFIEYDMVIGK